MKKTFAWRRSSTIRCCPAAPSCGSRPVRVCYVELDAARFPYGMGRGVPLVPDRSAAVDPDFVALGQWLYVEELDGLVPPGATEPHDGCLRAEDTGGGIDANHIDIFAGTRDRWLAWERILPTRSPLTVCPARVLPE